MSLTLGTSLSSFSPALCDSTIPLYTVYITESTAAEIAAEDPKQEIQGIQGNPDPNSPNRNIVLELTRGDGTGTFYEPSG